MEKKTRNELLEDIADKVNDAKGGLAIGASYEVVMAPVWKALEALQAEPVEETGEAAETIDARIEARKKKESEELDKFCLDMARGYVHEHEIWRLEEATSREKKIKFMGTWLRRCCNEAIDIGGSYSEGLEKGRNLQKDEDEQLLRQVENLRERLNVEGDQTLLDALEWKLVEENRVLREEVGAMAKEKRKDGFELGVHEMRIRIEKQLKEAVSVLIKRGPDVT